MIAVARSNRMEFGLLGAFQVTLGERPVGIGSLKQRTLLAMLTMHLNRPVPIGALIGALWGDNLPASAHTTVQGLVSRLRRALADGDVEMRARGLGYVLEADPIRVDAHRFERLGAQGREMVEKGELEEAVVSYRAALALWRGPALADLADKDFAVVEAARLDEARLALTEELVEAELAVGRPAEALSRLEPHVAAHPLRERAWGQLMVALYRLGRQAEALRAYQRVRKILGDELGLEPTPALRQLEEQILLQRPELESPPLPLLRARSSLAEPSRGSHRQLRNTLVFLFVDVDASTARSEGLREVPVDEELLAAALKGHGGNAFLHPGSPLGWVFPTAPQAFDAALAVQRSRLAQSRVAELPGVRMAIHAGPAGPNRDGYAGPAVKRAVGLLAIAHAGQILCSQEAADLGWEELSDRGGLVDLGRHRLSDGIRTERVFQVAHPELPVEFPPLRSPAAHRHNLPSPLTSFVGRESELAELKALLHSSRLVTLTGVGGAGKSRLALALATRSLPSFPEGVFLIDLAPLGDPGLLAFEVASALGIQTVGVDNVPGALEDRLAEYLAPRRALLLFDNCERLGEVVAALVEVLLSRCPEVAVVATSRELLGVAGEVAWRAPSLSMPPPGATRPFELESSDAVSLFCARAEAAKPGFALTPANAHAVAGICRRLDGIPLALELAAARLRLLSADQIAERLDDRFRLLTGGTRAALRHQTLRATMDWSWELLARPEQVALRRLAVFPGSFDLEAAEAVVGGDEEEGILSEGAVDVLDLLAHLVDKSLVAVEDEGAEVRYRLLETVRHYAGERLAEAGEEQATRRRHRDFYLALVQPSSTYWVHGAIWGSTPARFRAEYDNLRSALEWSLAAKDARAALPFTAGLWKYWLWGEGELEGCAWLERALALESPPRTSALVESLLGLGYLSWTCGRIDAEGTQQLLEEALTLALELGDRPGEAHARFYLAGMTLVRGDLERAQREGEEALKVWEASSLVLGASFCRYILGWIALERGDAPGARAHFEQAAEIRRRGDTLDYHVVASHALSALAPLVASSGDVALAETLADEGVDAARHLWFRQILVMTLVRSAEVSIVAGRPDRAVGRVIETLRLLWDLGAERWVAEALELAALLVAHFDHPASAARIFGACDALRDSRGERAGEGRCVFAAVQACRQRVTEALGADRYESQWKQGRRMTLGEAMSYSLGELTRSQEAGPSRQ